MEELKLEAYLASILARLIRIEEHVKGLDAPGPDGLTKVKQEVDQTARQIARRRNIGLM